MGRLRRAFALDRTTGFEELWDEARGGPTQRHATSFEELWRDVGDEADEDLDRGEQTLVSLNMRSGGVVGNTSNATNVREDVLHAMDRMHTLWSITNANYDAEYPRVRALSPGQRITNPAQTIPHTLAAIEQTREPTLHPRVVKHFFEVDISATVGRGAANHWDEVVKVQRILHALGLLAADDFTRESRAARDFGFGSVPASRIPRTLEAIVAAKVAIASARLGWAPIHADELESGGDRFGGRTYHFQNLSIFVPRGVVSTRNDVHVFFSPGGVQGDSGLNATLHHGLRGACEGTGWILISVPGVEPGFVTIDTATIEAALAHIGRGTRVDKIRLSAHSRGYRGLRETLDRTLIDLAKIDRVVILDAGYDTMAAALRRARIRASNVVCYVVTVQALPLAGARNVRIGANCARAIGYSRLTQDAMRTRPSLAIPAAVRSKLLTLPARGRFAAATPATGGADDLTGFCRTNAAAITSALQGETATPHGLKTFFDANDLGRLGSPFSQGIYAHHFFVAEIAHEITR